MCMYMYVSVYISTLPLKLDVYAYTAKLDKSVPVYFYSHWFDEKKKSAI